MRSVPSKVADLPIRSITESPLHFKRHHDADALEELADSIEQVGLLHPVIVRKKGKVYEYLAGERRLQAAKKNGAKDIRCTIVDCDDYHAELLSIQENTVGTEHMSSHEQKAAVDRVVELHAQQIGKRQDAPDEERISPKESTEQAGRKKAAEVTGFSESKVARLRRVDKLVPAAVRAFEQEKITLAQADKLSAMPHKEQMAKLPKMIRETNRETEHRETLEKLGAKDPDHKLAVKLFNKLKTNAEALLEIVESLHKKLTPEVARLMEEEGVDVLEALDGALGKLLTDVGTVDEWSSRRDN